MTDQIVIPNDTFLTRNANLLITLSGLLLLLIILFQSIYIKNQAIYIVEIDKEYVQLKGDHDEYLRTVDASLMNTKHIRVQALENRKSIVLEWCMIQAKSFIPEKEVEEIIDIAFKYDRWKLILSIITIESHFDRYAKSGKDAGGLMQVMFSVWGEELNIRNERVLYDPEENIKYGNEVLDRYLVDTTISNALYKYVGKDKGREYEKKVLVKYADLSVFLSERLKSNG